MDEAEGTNESEVVVSDELVGEPGAEDRPSPSAASRDHALPGEEENLDLEFTALDRAWEEVEADWENPKTHEKYLVLCQQIDLLSDAGARYRKVRETNPERADEAKARIDKILAIAMASLAATGTSAEPAQQTRRFITLVAAGLSLALILGSIYFWIR